MRSQQWFNDEIMNIVKSITDVEQNLEEVSQTINELSDKELNNQISRREAVKLEHLRDEKRELQRKCTQLGDEKLLLLKQMDQFQLSDGVSVGAGPGTASTDDSFELTLPSSTRETEPKVSRPYSVQTFHSRFPNARTQEFSTNNPHWDYFETVSLIREYGHLIDNFKKSHRNQSLWEHVSRELRERNIFRDWKQCKNRWKLILDKFYEDSRSPYSTSQEEKHTCEFFEELNTLFKNYGEYPAPSQGARPDVGPSGHAGQDNP